tara:strand:+ start:3114 stop:3860 length:747 start_codon:yes stop_codon:yes gene_type:complete
MANRQQISGRGVAQESGLQVFRNITTFSGEYLNWGNADSYGTSLGSDTDYTVDNSATDPHLDALTGSRATAVGQWRRYHTDSGSNYAAATAPTSGSGRFTFNGKQHSGNVSYSGMYQMMSLQEGETYKIELLTPIDADAGVLYINTYTPVQSPTVIAGTFKLTSTANISYPIIRSTIGLVTSEFTARNENDILLVYFTTLETSTTNVDVKNISVKLKEDFLIPIYSEDRFGNTSKVLRRKVGNPIFNR